MSVKEKKYSAKDKRVTELREITSSVDIEKLLHGLPEKEFREQRLLRAREIIHTHALQRVKIFDGLMAELAHATFKNKDIGTRGLIIEKMLNFMTSMADEMDLITPGSFKDEWLHIRSEWKLALSVVFILFALIFVLTHQ